MRAAFALVAAIVGVLATPATAAAPGPASGSIVFGPRHDDLDTQFVGANIVVEGVRQILIEGTISVFLFADETETYSTASGASSFTDVATEVVSLNAPGCPSTAPVKITLTLRNTPSDPRLRGKFRAVATDSSGVLVEGTVEQPDVTFYQWTYSGHVHCP